MSHEKTEFGQLIKAAVGGNARYTVVFCRYAVQQCVCACWLVVLKEAAGRLQLAWKYPVV